MNHTHLDTLLRRQKAIDEKDIDYLRWETVLTIRTPKGVVTEAYRQGWERIFKLKDEL